MRKGSWKEGGRDEGREAGREVKSTPAVIPGRRFPSLSMLEHEQFFTLRSLQPRGKVRAPTAERLQGDFTEGYGPRGHKETTLCVAIGEGSLEDKGSCLELPGDITQREDGMHERP